MQVKLDQDVQEALTRSASVNDRSPTVEANRRLRESLRIKAARAKYSSRATKGATGK